MRGAIAGLAMLSILGLAMWAGGPSGAGPDAPPSTEMADDLAARIGVGRSAPRVSASAVEIAVAPPAAVDAGPAPVPVRHDRETARRVWGQPAAFAPPE